MAGMVTPGGAGDDARPARARARPMPAAAMAPGGRASAGQ